MSMETLTATDHLEIARLRIAALEVDLAAAMEWRRVALSLGETWASNTPDGYHDMTPGRWLAWMDDVLTEREWDAQ